MEAIIGVDLADSLEADALKHSSDTRLGRHVIRLPGITQRSQSGRMQWTAPEVIRPRRQLINSERSSLDHFLDFHRSTLMWKCQGLTGAQLVARSLPGSRLCLLGLVRHMAEMERWWLQRSAAGLAELGDVYADDCFEAATANQAQADFATFEAECAASRDALRVTSLDDLFSHPGQDFQLDVRFAYTHMLEEYARHNGHADLLREHLDGTVGH